MSWKIKVAMYGWTEHPDYTPDLEQVKYKTDRVTGEVTEVERLESSRHRISEIVEIDLQPRSAEESTRDALTVIANLRREQVTDHVTKMQALNEIEAKYLCLTHDSSRPDPQPEPPCSICGQSPCVGVHGGDEVMPEPFARPSTQMAEDDIPF